ncbi:MAG: hypothetical protein RBU30_08725 [Polyangia bacterium]|nr:hypothetical protein [Polyangia bacterium]
MVLETSLGEMLELGDLYRMMKAILCEVIGMPPGPGTIGCVDGCPPLPAPNQPGDQCPGEPFEPGPESPEFRPKDFTQVRELLAEMRQIIRAHAALRQRLDELGAPKERISDLEARLVGVVHRRFAGRQDVQEALLDPQRRTKILSLLHRFVTSQRSQEAAAAALGDGRPDQPGDPP